MHSNFNHSNATDLQLAELNGRRSVLYEVLTDLRVARKSLALTGKRSEWLESLERRYKEEHLAIVLLAIETLERQTDD